MSTDMKHDINNRLTEIWAKIVEVSAIYWLGRHIDDNFRFMYQFSQEKVQKINLSTMPINSIAFALWLCWIWVPREVFQHMEVRR